MPYVMVPVPEEHVQEAMEAVLRIIARAHTDQEVEHLVSHGASEAVMGERELANGMLARAEKA